MQRLALQSLRDENADLTVRVAQASLHVAQLQAAQSDGASQASANNQLDNLTAELTAARAALQAARDEKRDLEQQLEHRFAPVVQHVWGSPSRHDEDTLMMEKPMRSEPHLPALIALPALQPLDGDDATLRRCKQLEALNAELGAENTDLRNSLSSTAGENADLTTRIDELTSAVNESHDCIIELTAKLNERQQQLVRQGSVKAVPADLGFGALRDKGAVVTALDFHSPQAALERSRPISPNSASSSRSSMYSRRSASYRTKRNTELPDAVPLPPRPQHHATVVDMPPASPNVVGASSTSQPVSNQQSTASEAGGWTSGVSKLASWLIKQ